jgi:hypothetical protein
MHKNAERGYLDALFKRLEKLGYDRPSSIVESERPDFILEIGGRTVGVEVTLAVEGEYVRAEKLQKTPDSEEAAILTNLKDGNRRRSNKEIIHNMFGDQFEPEQAWKGIDVKMIEWILQTPSGWTLHRQISQNFTALLVDAKFIPFSLNRAGNFSGPCAGCNTPPAWPRASAIRRCTARR